MPYWNKLPLDAKNSLTVLSFKIKLEGFKKDVISKSITNDCFFGMCLIMFVKETLPSNLSGRPT